MYVFFSICQWRLRITSCSPFEYQPKRDVAFDNGIMIHELTHGLTKRMTGGGTASGLQHIEGKGLSEGWSDAMAEYISILFRLNLI